MQMQEMMEKSRIKQRPIIERLIIIMTIVSRFINRGLIMGRLGRPLLEPKVSTSIIMIDIIIQMFKMRKISTGRLVSSVVKRRISA